MLYRLEGATNPSAPSDSMRKPRGNASAASATFIKVKAGDAERVVDVAVPDQLPVTFAVSRMEPPPHVPPTQVFR
jgi:hypothetical protein